MRQSSCGGVVAPCLAEGCPACGGPRGELVIPVAVFAGPVPSRPNAAAVRRLVEVRASWGLRTVLDFGNVRTLHEEAASELVAALRMKLGSEYDALVGLHAVSPDQRRVIASACQPKPLAVAPAAFSNAIVL